MSAFMRDWIGATVVQELTSILKEVQHGGDSRKHYPILKRHLTKPKRVQIIQGNDSRLFISDGTTIVEAEFDETEVEKFTRASERSLSGLEGGVIGMINYDIVCYFIFLSCRLKLTILSILNLDTSSPLALKILVGSFKPLGSEGSAQFGKPKHIKQNQEVQDLVEQLAHAHRNDGIASSMSQSPIQSQEIPAADQDHISVVHSYLESQIATQVQDYGERPAARVVSRPPINLLAALKQSAQHSNPPTNEPAPQSMRSGSKVVMKQVSEKRAKEMATTLDAKANQQKSQFTAQLDALHGLEPPLQTESSKQNSREVLVQLCDDNEKENSQESVHKDAPKQTPVTPTPNPAEEIKSRAPFKDFDPRAGGRTKLSRREGRVPSDQGDPAEFSVPPRDERLQYAKIPPQVAERLRKFYSQQSHPMQNEVKPPLDKSTIAVSNESADGRNDDEDLEDSDEEEAEDEVEPEVEEDDDDDDDDDDEEDGASTPISLVDEKATIQSSDDEESEADDEESQADMLDIDTQMPPLSPSPSSMAEQHSSLDHYESPSPDLARRSHTGELSNVNGSRQNSPTQDERVAKSTKQNPPTRARLPVTFPSSPSQEDCEDDELDLAVLYGVGDVVEDDEEESHMPETSQELPCTGPPNGKQVLVEHTPHPVRPEMRLAKGKMEKNELSSEYVHSDSVIPATFDSSIVDSSLSSSALREVIALEREQFPPTPLVPEIPSSVSLPEATPPVSPMVQIPATSRKANPSTPHTSSPNTSHDPKRTAETASFKTSGARCSEGVDHDDDGRRARQIARDNKRNFLVKVRAKSTVTAPNVDVPSLRSAGDAHARVSSTYLDESLERVGTNGEYLPSKSQLTTDSRGGASIAMNNGETRTSGADMEDVFHAGAAPKIIYEPAVNSEIPCLQYNDAANPKTSNESQTTAASQTGLGLDNAMLSREEAVHELSSSEVVHEPRLDNTDMADYMASSPGSPPGNSTQLIFYDEFRATYPDYEGNKVDFTQAVVYLEWLDKACKTTPKYCDDFIRVLADDYKKFVAQYKKQMNHNNAQVVECVNSKKGLTGYEFYQRQSSEPRYLYKVIGRQNIQAVLCTLDSQLVKEMRSIFLQDEESPRDVSSITTNTPLSTVSMKSTAFDDTHGPIPLAKATPTRTLENPITRTSRERSNVAAGLKKRFFETASQQVEFIKDNIATPNKAYDAASNIGDEQAKSGGQWPKSAMEVSRQEFSINDNGFDGESRRKTLPWMTRSASVDLARKSDKKAKWSTSFDERPGSPILGSLRDPSPESRDLKRKRLGSFTTNQLDDPFKSSPAFSKAARRTTMPARSMEDPGGPPRDLKRQRTSQSSPRQDLDDPFTTSLKTSTRRTTMPAGGIDRVGRVKEWVQKTPLKTTKTSWNVNVDQLVKSGWVPPSKKRSAKKAIPSEPHAQASDF